MYRRYGQGFATVDGQQAIVQETVRVTQFNSGASAIAQYPFSRVHRVEFSAGVRRIGFDAEIETQFFSPITGELFDEQTRICRGPTRSTWAKRPRRSSTTRRSSAPPARWSAAGIDSSTRSWPAR